MGKHLLVASDLNHIPARYFVGYEDAGEVSMTIWTTDFWKAKWFEADDAEIEAVLLSGLCPNYIVEAKQVNGGIVGRMGR
jgi:hypothetical protein